MADITRAEVASLIAEAYPGTVIEAATAGSTALSAFPTYNMGTKTANLPVLATLPTASWVSDTDNTGKGYMKALTNATKQVLDALTGLAWDDDSQVDDIHARRMPPSKTEPKTIVTVTRIEVV
jgi:hypothetical protein